MKAIVVLGTRIIRDSQNGEYSPSSMLKMRLDKTYEKYLEVTNDQTIIVTSGGSPHGESRSESSVMKAYLIDKGIPLCKIFEENKSNNTSENCTNTYALLDDLYLKRLTLQELIPNFQSNYYGSDVSGEIPPFMEICVVTSDFHIPRSKLLFKRINKTGMILSFVGSPTPEDVAPQYIQNEKRLMAKLQ